MKYKTFKDFLISKHADQYHGVDDDMPDDFNKWLYCQLSENIDKIMEYANEYAAIQKKEIVEKIEKPKDWDNWSIERQLGYKFVIQQLSPKQELN